MLTDREEGEMVAGSIGNEEGVGKGAQLYKESEDNCEEWKERRMEETMVQSRLVISMKQLNESLQEYKTIEIFCAKEGHGRLQLTKGSEEGNCQDDGEGEVEAGIGKGDEIRYSAQQLSVSALVHQFSKESQIYQYIQEGEEKHVESVVRSNAHQGLTDIEAVFQIILNNKVLKQTFETLKSTQKASLLVVELIESDGEERQQLPQSGARGEEEEGIRYFPANTSLKKVTYDQLGSKQFIPIQNTDTNRRPHQFNSPTLKTCFKSVSRPDRLFNSPFRINNLVRSPPTHQQHLKTSNNFSKSNFILFNEATRTPAQRVVHNSQHKQIISRMRDSSPAHTSLHPRIPKPATHIKPVPSKPSNFKQQSILHARNVNYTESY